MNYYIILSEGEYSDYSPQYFVGSREITREELDKKGIEVGDSLFEWFDSLPKRTHVPCKWKCWSGCPQEESYGEDGERVYSHELAEKWFEQMKVWVKERGFEPLPEQIPEINVAYSDIPNSNSRKSKD